MSNSDSKAEKYNRTVEKAELLQIAATQGVFKISPEYAAKCDAATKLIDQQVIDEPAFDESESVLVGQIRCRVWMSEAGAPVSKVALDDEGAFLDSLLALEVVYVVAFEISGQHDQETLTSFFNRMAPLSTWAYFRSHVARIAGEACVDIPVLPIKKLSYPLGPSSGYQDVSKPVAPRTGTK